MIEADQLQQSGSSNEEDESHSKETSLLFEPFTFWCLLAFLLIAIWFKLLPLIAVFTFLLILSILIITWKKKALTNLNFSLQVPKSRLFVDEELIVHAKVKNNKWLPLIWLEWEFQRNHVIVWGENHEPTYITRFLWLLSYQQVNWTVIGKVIHRGVYNIGHVTVRSGDGFRFAETEQVHHLASEIYVYPKLLPVRVPAFRPSMQWEVKGKQGGFLEDPLLVSGIREYEAGDEWRRFNWRASARAGKMLTNVYQPIVSEQLDLFIDVKGFVINKERYEDEILKQQKYEIRMKETFETFLSLVASFAVAYQEQGISIGFTSNGLNHLGRKQQSIPPRNHLTPILDQMAQMTQHASVQPTSLLDEMLFKRQSVPLFIFCERITQAYYLWYEHNKQTLDIRFYYVYGNDYSVKLTESAKQIDYLREQVAVSGS